MTYTDRVAAELRAGCTHNGRPCYCQVGLSIALRRPVAELFPTTDQEDPVTTDERHALWEARYRTEKAFDRLAANVRRFAEDFHKAANRLREDLQANADKLSGGPEWMPIDGPSLARCVCGIAHGVPRLDAAARQAVVDQFKTALLTGLDDLQRHGNDGYGGRCIYPGDVADLVARVAQEVGRG